MIVKVIEDSGVYIKGTSTRIDIETKDKKVDFLVCYLLSDERAEATSLGRGEMRAGIRVIRAGEGTFRV